MAFRLGLEGGYLMGVLKVAGSVRMVGKLAFLRQHRRARADYDVPLPSTSAHRPVLDVGKPGASEPTAQTQNDGGSHRRQTRSLRIASISRESLG